jgi:hypothetical protein
MKNLRFLLVAFLLLVNAGASVAQEDPKTMNVPDGKAIIYIIRVRDGNGMFRSVNKIDGIDLPTMGSRNFVYMVVDPGDHKILCKGSTKESLMDLKVEAGKKYYVIQRVSAIVMGVYWAKIALEDDEKAAQKIIKDCIEAKFKEAK